MSTYLVIAQNPSIVQLYIVYTVQCWYLCTYLYHAVCESTL